MQGDKAVLKQAVSPPTVHCRPCLFIDPCKETIPGNQQFATNVYNWKALGMGKFVALDAADAEHLSSFLDCQSQTCIIHGKYLSFNLVCFDISSISRFHSNVNTLNRKSITAYLHIYTINHFQYIHFNSIDFFFMLCYAID